MGTCSSCGATLPAGAAWCGQCFAPAGAAAPAPQSPTSVWPGPAVPTASGQPLMRTTRWGKTTTTFGPVGRVLLTVLVLIPVAVMLVGGLADMFAWGGAGVYCATIGPWALRDIWRAGQVPVR